MSSGSPWTRPDSTPKTNQGRGREMVQWGRGAGALAEEPGWSPSTHIAAHDSQSSMTAAPKDPMSSSGLRRRQACVWYTDTHSNKISIHIRYKFKNNSNN